jgi:nitrogen fixation protein NifU and related proteins
MDDIYREIIIEESKHPHNYGKLEGADVSSHHLNPSCGDEITVYIKLSDDKKTIQTVMWEGQGCAISKAGMSLLSEQLPGMSVAEINHLDKKYMEKLIGFDEVVPGREKCMMVGVAVTKKAVQ